MKANKMIATLGAVATLAVSPTTRAADSVCRFSGYVTGDASTAAYQVDGQVTFDHQKFSGLIDQDYQAICVNDTATISGVAKNATNSISFSETGVVAFYHSLNGVMTVGLSSTNGNFEIIERGSDLSSLRDVNDILQFMGSGNKTETILNINNGEINGFDTKPLVTLQPGLDIKSLEMTVTVSYPVFAAGARVMTSTNLGTGNWSSATNYPYIKGDLLQVTLPKASSGSAFYSLAR